MTDTTIPAEVRAMQALALAGDAETPEDAHRLKQRAQELAAQAEAEQDGE